MTSSINAGPRTTGYQGFKSNGMQECPTLKPGESYESRNTKFAKMGSHIVQPASANRLGHATFDTVTTQSTTNVQPRDYHVPDKRGVMASETPPPSKPFRTSSIYQSDFLAYAQEARDVLAHPMEQYEAAFEALADASQNASDRTIDYDQVRAVLDRALGPHVSKRVVNMYLSYFDRAGHRERISWGAFRAGVDKISGGCLSLGPFWVGMRRLILLFFFPVGQTHCGSRPTTRAPRFRAAGRGSRRRTRPK